MRPRFLLALAAVASFGVAAGCSDSASLVAPPAAPPAAPADPGPVSSWPPAPPFPPLARAGEIYTAADSAYDSPSSLRYHGSRLASRYVFYADGTFGLQFSSARAGFFEYRGRYARTDARITFDWDGWSIAGPWGATGTLSGDTLRVEYNTIMQATDFVDGMYVRVPGTADGGDPCYGCWDY